MNPLDIEGNTLVYKADKAISIYHEGEGAYFTLEGARALRDWLNKVLGPMKLFPKELVGESKYMSLTYEECCLLQPYDLADCSQPPGDETRYTPDGLKKLQAAEAQRRSAL